ncbi:hypothetical protein H671_6g15712 [Cricetulus griseus]|uniref:Uncharacterized protein n=1 Tax=Cricetulus griseus TaxID=10029 RepID=A0A061HZ14_CRIGR|nr:hypothetical protein H671_6g15712 [Cricetulus griseus]
MRAVQRKSKLRKKWKGRAKKQMVSTLPLCPALLQKTQLKSVKRKPKPIQSRLAFLFFKPEYIRSVFE